MVDQVASVPVSVPWGEYAKWLAGESAEHYYLDKLNDATTKPARDRERKKIIKSQEMPWENAPEGLLKHLVNESMNTRSETVDAYMQVIPPGSHSGRHRQLAEQAFYVVEGHGYDLHVDCDLELTHEYQWKPQETTQRFEWDAGDVVYIPPNTICQHFNGDNEHLARIIVITNRIYKDCGLNDLEQYENAPEYDPKETLSAERLRRYLRPVAAGGA